MISPIIFEQIKIYKKSKIYIINEIHGNTILFLNFKKSTQDIIITKIAKITYAIANILYSLFIHKVEKIILGKQKGNIIK